MRGAIKNADQLSFLAVQAPISQELPEVPAITAFESPQNVEVPHSEKAPPAAAVTSESLIKETLPDYAVYLAASGNKDSTIGLFTADVRKLSDFLPKHPVGGILVGDLRAFIAKYGKNDSLKTSDRRVTALKNFFRWLHRDSIISENPAAKLIYPKAPCPLPTPLTREEVRAFLESAKASDKEYVIATLFLGAGLKRSEALLLTAQSIEMDGGPSPEDPPRAPILTVSPAERNKGRRIKLPLDSIEYFRRYLSGLLPADNLLRISKRRLTDIVLQIGNRAGINTPQRSVTAKLLRDTFALQLLRAGRDIDRVMATLGLDQSEANDDIKRKYKNLLQMYP